MEDYTNLLPLMPPEGVIEWAQKRGKLNGHIITYEKTWLTDPLTGLKHTCCKCVCSACREVFYLDYRPGGVSSGYPNNTYSCYNPVNNETFGDWSSTLCPECKTPVRTLRRASLKDYHYSGDVRPTTIHVIDKDKLAVIYWRITRKIYPDMRISMEYIRDEAYILDGKKLIRFRGFEMGMFGYTTWLDHWVQCKRSEDCSGSTDADDVFGFNMKQLEGTKWENCKLDRYLKSAKHNARIVLYLRSFAQYPAQQQVQPTTNKIYVTSLEDALQRYASPNSTMIYVLQDESAVFEVFTDMQGKKVPKVKKLVDFAPENDGGGFVSRAEFDELKQKFEAFTAKGE